MNGSFFQNMAPNARRSFMVTVLVGAAAVVLYMFAVQPAAETLAKAHAELDELSGRQQIVNANLRGAPQTKSRLAALDEAFAPFDREMLEPLLASYAMRAKSIVEPLALESGLSNLDYADAPDRALPMPKPAPKQLHLRKAVRITAQGSYMGAVSFLLRLERAHPLVSLQSFAINSTAKPERQQIEMVLEWPAKGAVTK